MTEEILNAAILRLKSEALEHYGIIKDLYHQPKDKDTVDKICVHAAALAQFEGAMLTLQQYAEQIKQPPPEMPAPVEEQPPEPDPTPIRGEELEKRSPTYRKSVRGKKSEPKTKKKSE